MSRKKVKSCLAAVDSPLAVVDSPLAVRVGLEETVGPRESKLVVGLLWMSVYPAPGADRPPNNKRRRTIDRAPPFGSPFTTGTPCLWLVTSLTKKPTASF